VPKRRVFDEEESPIFTDPVELSQRDSPFWASPTNTTHWLETKRLVRRLRGHAHLEDMTPLGRRDHAKQLWEAHDAAERQGR
jgi:hypothetical protein